MADLAVAVGAEDHSMGGGEEAVTLVEYGDYECPHCAMAHRAVKQVMEHFGDKVRFVYRNFPLEMHPMAEPAAEAAEYAATKGKFWKMHDGIFEHQRELSVEMLAALAKRVGLNAEEAEEAIEEGSFSERIERDMEGGERARVHGTPTFFVNGRKHVGAFGVDELRAAIEAEG